MRIHTALFCLLLVNVSFAQEKVVLDVPTADVREVVRSIADANGFSVYIPGELTGTISLRADGIPYRELLDAVLAPRGYGYRISKTGLVVIEKIPLAGASVIVKNRSAFDIAEALTKVLRTGERVQAVGEFVVIDGEAERVGQLSRLAVAIDKPLRQVLVECRFQEVTTSFTRNLGLDWSSLGSLSLSLTPQPIDVGTGQAMSAVFRMSQLSTVISAFDNSSDARLISRPTLLASEGKESAVSVGQQYPLPQYTFSHEQGVLQVSGFEFKDIGILLKVTPRFAGSRIVLDLEPEVSSVTGTTTFNGVGSSTLPIIATRKVKTQVELSDGDTIAISGLVTSSDTGNLGEVRGMAGVPIIGGLFRNRGKKKEGTELIVLVTVRVIHRAADSLILSPPQS